MKTFDAIKLMLKECGKSQRAVSLEMGRTQNWLNSTLLIAKDSKAGTLAHIADICGFDLLLRSRSTGKEIQIDPTDEP